MIASILKHCRNGLLYILTLPILVLALSIFAIIGIFEFIILGSKAIYYFFTGRNLFGDLPEDIKVKAILAEMSNPVTTLNLKEEVKEEVVENSYLTQNEEENYTETGVDISYTDNDDIGGEL